MQKIFSLLWLVYLLLSFYSMLNIVISSSRIRPSPPHLPTSPPSLLFLANTQGTQWAWANLFHCCMQSAYGRGWSRAYYARHTQQVSSRVQLGDIIFSSLPILDKGVLNLPICLFSSFLFLSLNFSQSFLLLLNFALFSNIGIFMHLRI